MTPTDTAWERLHPLSPVVRGGRILGGLVVVFGARQLGSRADTGQVIVDFVIAALVVLGGLVAWLVTRWRVHGGDLQLETGLLRRRSTRVPLARVQAVDVVRPLIARMLGMSELRVVLAGQGSGTTRLAYLGEDRALAVRAQLLALAHGLDEQTPEPGERPIVAVDNGRLVVSALLGASTFWLVALLIAVVALAFVAPAALGSLPVLLVGVVIGIARRVNAEFNFVAAESPDGLRIRAGMLQTTAETIPYARIQAVRLVEPLLWRPFGWCRLEVDVAQQRQRDAEQQESRRLSRALLPVGRRADADHLLARIFPGLTLTTPPGSRAPRIARLKAPLSYPILAAWSDGRFVITRTGRVTARTIALPLHKAQSVRYVQGPVQRRLGLATVAVDTAGRRWSAVARDRTQDEARRWVDQLVRDMHQVNARS